MNNRCAQKRDRGALQTWWQAVFDLGRGEVAGPKIDRGSLHTATSTANAVEAMTLSRSTGLL